MLLSSTWRSLFPRGGPLLAVAGIGYDESDCDGETESSATYY